MISTRSGGVFFLGNFVKGDLSIFQSGQTCDLGGGGKGGNSFERVHFFLWDISGTCLVTGTTNFRDI